VRHWVRDTVGGLPRPFWYLWANTLINRVGSFVLILLAFYLTEERHLTPSFAGLVIGLWGAGGAAGTLLGGVLADRWGRKPTFLTALYGSAAMMLVLGSARAPLVIALSVVALGLVSEASRPAMQALMIDIVPQRDRVRAFSLHYWVINLGFAFAATTAGLVAGIDFRLLFLIDAATTAAAATLVAVKIQEPARVRVPAVAPVPASTRPGLRAVFADRVFLTFVGINLLTSLVFMQHLSTLPIAMARDGLAPSTYGTVIALNGVLIVAGQLFMHRVLRRLARPTALAVAAVVMGLGFGLNAFAHTAWVYAVAVLVWTVGEMLNAPSNSATNAELAPAPMRGRYQGVFSLSWSCASFLAPLAGAAVLQYAGPATLWLGCLGVAAVVAVLHLLAAPSRQRRVQQLLGADHEVNGTVEAPGRGQPHGQLSGDEEEPVPALSAAS
jgi:MFS family permease